MKNTILAAVAVVLTAAVVSARGLGMNTTTPDKMFAKFPIGVQATR